MGVYEQGKGKDQIFQLNIPSLLADNKRSAYSWYSTSYFKFRFLTSHKHNIVVSENLNPKGKRTYSNAKSHFLLFGFKKLSKNFRNFLSKSLIYQRMPLHLKPQKTLKPNVVMQE